MTRAVLPNIAFGELLSAITVAEGAHDQIPVRAPYTGETVASLPACRVEDVERAMSLAREAQSEWAGANFGERARVLLRFHDLLLDRQQEALDIIQVETGKSRAHAFEEVLDTAAVARYYARRAERLLRTRRRKGAIPLLTRTHESRVPIGVVGFITPWNFPLTLGITDVIPALLAGNAVGLKPDPHASFTALWAVRLLRDCGLPRDVMGVVTGGPETGQAVVERADYVMFTGSNRAGRKIAAKAGERLIGCSLELGGKNPLIVLPDADLRAAAEGAVRACFAGAGQVCVSVERIYAHGDVYEKFIPLLIDRVKGIRLGAAFDYSMDVGSLTTEGQLSQVEAHVKDAVERGAVVLAGGRRRPDLGPLFFEPTILSGLRPGMKAFEEETFGPVAAVYSVASEEEAIAAANATRYGLSASVWTGNARRGERFARAIQAGSVNVNEGYAAAWGSVDAPIGGMKESGLVPRHGADGILKFTRSKTIATQRLMPIAASRGIPQEFFSRWMTRLLRILRHIPWLG
ncbi:MAG TPA: succinic semialdehyde dehydrogenase [Verrucomicrobiae bacterium]|nr:succinic semialdehyde dehydrogenase [Verrucomicrobiae bacterium]